jgi:hypothetical protein
MNTQPSAEEKLDAVIRAAQTILDKQSFVQTARAIFDQCREMTGAVSGYVALLSADGCVLIAERSEMMKECGHALKLMYQPIRILASVTAYVLIACGNSIRKGQIRSSKN